MKATTRGRARRGCARDELGELQFGAGAHAPEPRRDHHHKNYLNTVLNSLSDAVLVTSPDGILKSCNEATQRLLGYQESDLVGKPLTSFIDDERIAAPSTPTNFDHREHEKRCCVRPAWSEAIPVSMANSTITSEECLSSKGNIYRGPQASPMRKRAGAAHSRILPATTR